jgi:hypothetical protein
MTYIHSRGITFTHTIYVFHFFHVIFGLCLCLCFCLSRSRYFLPHTIRFGLKLLSRHTHKDNVTQRHTRHMKTTTHTKAQRKRQRDKETKRQRDKETKRQRDKETTRQRDKGTKRQRKTTRQRQGYGKSTLLLDSPTSLF